MATNAETFEEIRTGDKLLWNGITRPVTVVAGYKDGMEDIAQYDNVQSPIVTLEGPNGGEKMLIQNDHDPNAIRVETFSLHGNGEWIQDLQIAG